MKRLIISLALLYILIFPNTILAEEKHTEVSAILKSQPAVPEKLDQRLPILRQFLKKHHSPLAELSGYIIQVSDAYHLPWTMIAAISGVESGFCQRIPFNSYNCWGWNNGDFRFIDYEDGVYTVAKSLKFNYFDKGLVNPYLINPVYAPPSTVWGSKVDYFMKAIENTTSDEIPISSF